MGALRDGVTLSWKDSFILREICTLISQEEIGDAPCPFQITHLSVVLFLCRSLERRLVTYPISLMGKKLKSDDSPPRYHTLLVDNVMAQFSETRLLEYLKDLQKEGNRELSYRCDHIEATLVWDLPQDIPSYIERFIEEIDKKLPGLYSWFDPKSLHMTVRALV